MLKCTLPLSCGGQVMVSPAEIVALWSQPNGARMMLTSGESLDLALTPKEANAALGDLMHIESDHGLFSEDHIVAIAETNGGVDLYFRGAHSVTVKGGVLKKAMETLTQTTDYHGKIRWWT